MSFIKKTACFLCAASFITLCAAENMLKNAEFSRLKNGFPRRWKLTAKTKDACKITPKTVTLSGAGTMFCQEYLSIASNQMVEVKAKVKGNGTFRIYVDWPGSARKAVHTAWQDFNEDWRAINAFNEDFFNVAFTFISPAQEKKAPRLVIEMKSGTLAFSDLEIIPYQPPMALGLKWNVAGSSRLVKDNGADAVLLGFHTFNTPSAYLKNVKVKPNTWYEFSRQYSRFQ